MENPDTMTTKSQPAINTVTPTTPRNFRATYRFDGKKLTALREKAGMDEYQFAHELYLRGCHVSRNELGQIERESPADRRVSFLGACVDILHCRMEDLLSFTDDPAKKA
jgi:transcriptional regulator with XRE-family HTH domain